MSSYRTLTSYAPATPGFAPAGSSFQLADFTRLVRTRRALIAQVTLAVMVFALIVALSLPTVWSSSAMVMLDGRKNNITDVTAILSQLPNDPASVQNQIQILNSRNLAVKVVDELHLYEDPEFNAVLARPGLGILLNPREWFADDSYPSPQRQRDAVIDAFLKHVSADAVGLSTSITVTARASTPEKAAAIANGLVRAYVGDQIATKVDAAQSTVQWLSMRVNNLAEQLQFQDANIQRYKAQHNLNDSGPGNSLADQSMSGINAQLVQARSDLAEKQAQYDRVTQLQQTGNAADLPIVVSSPVIVQLRGQEAQLLQQESDLSSKYGPLHPKMQAIEAQKRDLNAKIAQEVNRAAASISNDLLVSKAHLNSLASSLGGAEHEAANQNMARVELAAMESNAASTRTMYEAFVQRLRQAQDQDAVANPESRIISTASIPTAPSAPKRSLIMAASLPLGLLLGLLAALAAEKFGSPIPVRINNAPRAGWISAPAPKPKKAPLPPKAVWNGPPILAQLTGASSLRAADYVIDWPDSRFSHGMTALVRQLESHGEAGAIVAVTSASGGESKSAIAVSLARAAARMGRKTVLIDCDPARLSSKAMNAPARNGLYDVLTGGMKLNEVLAKDPRSGAFLLAMPRRPANAATMFSSRAMTKLMSVLRGGAELVILDCGLASKSPEAALLARHADATVMVAREAALQTPALAEAARILESARAAPIGIVIVS